MATVRLPPIRIMIIMSLTGKLVANSDCVFSPAGNKEVINREKKIVRTAKAISDKIVENEKRISEGSR
jgi:hypothetical protein